MFGLIAHYPSHLTMSLNSYTISEIQDNGWIPKSQKYFSGTWQKIPMPKSTSCIMYLNVCTLDPTMMYIIDSHSECRRCFLLAYGVS